MNLTKAQTATLAKFLFATCLLGLAYEGRAARFAVSRLSLDEVMSLRNYRIPVADAVIGFAPLAADRSIWWTASLLGFVLVVALTLLLPRKDKASRTVLAVFAALYAVSGFDLLPRLAAGTMWLMSGGQVAVPTPPWSVMDFLSNAIPLLDGGILGLISEVASAADDVLPLLGIVATYLAAAALLYATWKPADARSTAA